MTNQRSVLVRGPDDGEKIYAGGDLYRFLAKSGDTDGCYAIWEAIVPPGGGPPPHLHRKEEEGFYVVAGEVMVYADGEAIKATPGALRANAEGFQALVPKRVEREREDARPGPHLAAWKDSLNRPGRPWRMPRLRSRHSVMMKRNALERPHRTSASSYFIRSGNRLCANDTSTGIAHRVEAVLV